jgi:3-polyprenyl-4-hydroxybenzoate decarboxylase
VHDKQSVCSRPLHRPQELWQGWHVGARPLRSTKKPGGQLSTHVWPSRKRPAAHVVQFVALPEQVAQLASHGSQRPRENCDASQVMVGVLSRLPGVPVSVKLSVTYDSS